MAAATSQIVATSQQSRFHTETLEVTTVKDIDLKQVNISVGDRELLVDARLQLFEGVRYGLIGRNGTGKSTLLKALGYGILVGLPRSVRVQYVDQLEGVDTEKSVVQLVLESDTRGQRLAGEARVVQEALEESDMDKIVAALRNVRLGRLESELREATQIATHRSGQRGLQARTRQVELEETVAAARSALAASADKEEVAQAAPAAQALVDDIFSELEALDMDGAEGRARVILKGLGIDDAQQDAPFGKLSGGWRMRVALAQALFMRPDVLLLDEPTNHLDLPAILWLQRYLTSLEGVTLVLVSHDRAFLNAVVEEVVVLRHQKLEYHTGNYDEYQQHRAEAQEHQEQLAEAVDRKRTHIEKSIQEGLRHAKKTGDDKKLGMVASRKKKLERLGVETNAHGHKFKLNRDMAGYHLTTRQAVAVDGADPTVVMRFPQPGPLRHKGPLLEVEGVSFRYAGAAADVLKDVTLNVQPGARIALVGANGEGKSTLTRIMMGELTPRAGCVTRHREASLGFFRQHHVEEIAAAPPDVSALSWLACKHPGVKEADLRAHLGALGVKGGVATQPLGSLSGGQAVRVALANTLWRGPQLLVLDEPTNHLDMDTIEALIGALGEYGGALVLVSHDQYLVDAVATGAVYLVSSQRLTLLEDGMAGYVRLLQHKSKKKKAVAAGGAKGGATGAKGAAAAQRPMAQQQARNSNRVA